MNRIFNIKKTALLVIFLLIAAMVFASGGGQQSAAGASGKPTLQIGIQTSLNVRDYKDNYMTRYLENLHDINLEFLMFPTGGADARTQFSLMAVSNNLPETIWGGFLTSLQIMEYGESRVLLPLNTYFNDPSKTPYFNRIPQADRAKMLLDTVAIDGNYYGFPMYTPETWGMTGYRMCINRSWLEILGLAEPKTTDELRNVLIAFRDRDPNGNGRQDEIGVFGFAGGAGENTPASLINSFVYWNPSENIALDSTGRTITAPFTEDGFRKGLQYLNGLYRDKLLDASLFTVDQQTFRAVLNTVPMVVGFSGVPGVGSFADYENNANYYAMMPIIEPLRGPDGICYTPYGQYFASSRSFITNKAKNVDLAVKVMDSFYEEDLSLICRYGEEGVDWTRDPAILNQYTNGFKELGILPNVLLHRLVDVNTNATGTSQYWGTSITPQYRDETLGNSVTAIGGIVDMSRPYTYHDATNYQLYIPKHPQYILPRLVYNTSDGATTAQISTDISTYIKQSIAEFVTNVRDINNDAAWNTYLRELNNMGLQQWLSIAQATLNRQQ